MSVLKMICLCIFQHEACNRGFVAVATMLLDYGATVDMPGDDNETPLHDAVCNGRVECAKLLVLRGASVTARYFYNYFANTILCHYY